MGAEQPLTTNSLRRIYQAAAGGTKIPLALELKKKIVAAEKQLEKAVQSESSIVPVSVEIISTIPTPAAEQAASESVKTNSQLEEITNKMVGTKTIVAPGARDAPKFNSNRPEELRRFLRQMEDLWKEADISDDSKKKEMLGKYADCGSEEEWAAFETYKDNYSWEQFKRELYENYPEAAEAERGTPQRLRQVCRDTREVSLGDTQALYAFRRKFQAEAKKLLVPPAVMSN